jgi:tetratricopeptide (TPR) repeat protein
MLTGVFLCLAITFSFAQALTVEYADGTVQVQAGKGWKDLSIGSKVAPDAHIRISDSGTVEFSRGAQRFSLLTDGVYALADMLKRSGRAGEPGIGVNLAKKLRNVATGGQQSSTTVGGVRGAAQGDNSQNLTWMGDDEDTSAKVRALLDKERYKEAEAEIKQALSDAQDDQKKQDLSYLLASAYYGEGEGARAYHTLLTLNDDTGSTYYSDSVILKAQILLDNHAYADSLQVLKDFLGKNRDNQYAQVGYLLSAQCYKGLGDDKSAKNSLDAGFALDPQSDTAKQIAKMQSN